VIGASSAATMKNRIINGDMRIDQRNAGASVTPTSAAYTVDRWQATLAQSSKYSVQRVADAPTGFTNSLKMTSLSAYTPGSGETFTMRQIIEGYNLQDLAYGTASAKTVTISFWVKSSLTGSFGVVLGNGNVGRTYGNLYTINNANTWEYKSVVVPGDTGAAIPVDNTQSLYLIFGLGVEASASAAAGSWQGSFYYGVNGATSLVSTNGATFYITGVQLEVGSAATSFDFRHYGQELALCQRYYQIQTNIVGSYYTNNSTTYWATPFVMRTNPTISVYGSPTLNNMVGGAAGTLTGTAAIDFGTAYGSTFHLTYTGASGVTTGSVVLLQPPSNNTIAGVAFSAEL
jgi:hypothetical protein